MALRDETLEVRLRLADRIRPGDADDVEALRARFACERRLDRREV
jgi:hypothetical protein